MTASYSPEGALRNFVEDGATYSAQMRDMGAIAAMHMQKIAASHGERLRRSIEGLKPLLAQVQVAAQKGELAHDAEEYARDAAERAVLMLDVLRERGNNDITHEAAGAPPVLVYDYETVMDGRDFAPRVNYMLLKIIPPQGVAVLDWKRPYMIIDPRAGHGAGIGGFKPDSQVGVALRAGHPVYFVAFRPEPEPGQTIADVMRAEAAFVGEIRRPSSRRGQAGDHRQLSGRLGAALLAAPIPNFRPDRDQWRAGGGLVRPQGRNPMRYKGGMGGGMRRPCSCPTSAAAFSTARISWLISRSSIPAAISVANITICSPTSIEGARELP